MLSVEGKVVVSVDHEKKNSYTFENGVTIRMERDWNNLNRRETQPVNAIVIDGEGFQQTWWNNLLYLVADMLSKYSNFNKLINTQFTDNFINNQVVYPRAYGQACTSFFKPCPYTYHCTSGNAQDLQEQGFKQVICNTHTKGVEVPVHLYRKHVLENIPLDELVTQSPAATEQFTGDFDLDNFINNF